MSALVVPVALVIGLSLGALGGGGAILTVPALVYLLGQNAHGATTASLVIVGLTALAGMLAHSRAGNVRLADGLVFGALGVAGSFAGSRLAAGIDADVLLAAFAVLMLVAAAAMARRRSRGAPARRPSGGQGPGDPGPGDTAPGVALATPDDPDDPVAGAGTSSGARRSWRQRLVVLGAATTVGLVTGFFGVGGGFVVVPALVLALGFAMPQAVGTSLLVIAVNSGAALLARIGTPVHVDWPLVGVFTAVAMAGTVVGNRIAVAARPERLAGAFTLLLVAVAIYTGARSVPHVV